MEKRHSLSPIRPSTLAFFREGRRLPGYSLLDWLHGYIYGRWPYFYIAIGRGTHPLARLFGPALRRLAGWLWLRSDGKKDGAEAESSAGTGGFADTYHGKVMPLEGATRLITLGEEVCLPNLENVIPYAQARDIVLRNPDHIVAIECPCRSTKPNPCLPLDVCLAVGEPFASFTAEHHPKRSRWITVEEAARILREEHERGHVHHAFFKDAMLGRFYAICNCCTCCCAAVNAHRNGTPMLASSGYLCRVDGASCLGCGSCAGICPFGAISVNGGPATVDADRCMGCGVCISHCSGTALVLVRDPSRSAPLDIAEIQNAGTA